MAGGIREQLGRRRRLLLVSQVRRDIGPELDEHGPNNALRGYREGALEGKASASVGLGIVKVGNAARS